MTQDERDNRMNTISDNVTALMIAVDAQTDVLGIINAQLEEVLKWMNRPASSDLHDALKDIAEALAGVNANLKDLPQRVLMAKAAR